MKNCVNILVLSALLFIVMPAIAEDIKPDQAGPRGGGRGRQLGQMQPEDSPRDGELEMVPPTQEMIDKFMEMLETENSELAKRLAELRKSSPEAFEKELMQHFKGQRGMREPGMGDGKGRGPREPGDMREGFNPGGRRARFAEIMAEREKEFKEWLEKNYPDAAKKLESIQEREGVEEDVRIRSLYDAIINKYKPIFDAEKRNPKMAELLKKDLELQEKRDKLILWLKDAKDDVKKAELEDALKGIVAERFDVIVQRQQLRYEELMDRLEKLQAYVKKEKASLEELKTKKDDHLKQRLEELLGKDNKLNWD